MQCDMKQYQYNYFNPHWFIKSSSFIPACVQATDYICRRQVVCKSLTSYDMRQLISYLSALLVELLPVL